MYKDYDDDYERREKREQTDYDLRNRGLIRDEFGHYSDPNSPWRTGGYVDDDGRFHADM